MNQLGSNIDKLLELISNDISEVYPTLLALIIAGQVHIKGTLRIKDNKDKELGSFLVDIAVPNNFPKEMPTVSEIGGSIPQLPERHNDVVPGQAHGRTCLKFRDAMYLEWSESCNIVDFIKKFVEPYFLWQIEYNLTGGKNSDQAFEHGVKGAIQFYSEILDIKGNKAVFKFVEYITKKKIKKEWPCYCLSGKSLRDCHINTLEKYRKKLSRKAAEKTLEDFKKYNILQNG